MSTGAAPAQTPPQPRPAPPSQPVAVQLAGYTVVLAVIAAVTVLAALRDISAPAVVGLLGVIVGAHGTVAAGAILGQSRSA